MKLVIDCVTGTSSLVDLTADEQTDLAARQASQSPSAQARANAVQFQSDIAAMVGQYRSKTMAQAVTGKEPT